MTKKKTAPVDDIRAAVVRAGVRNGIPANAKLVRVTVRRDAAGDVVGKDEVWEVPQGPTGDQRLPPGVPRFNLLGPITYEEVAEVARACGCSMKDAGHYLCMWDTAERAIQHHGKRPQ